MTTKYYFRIILLSFFYVAIVTCQEAEETTAVDVVGNVFESCVQYGSLSCVKPKFLKFLRESLKNDRIPLTDNLSIEKNGGKFSYESKEDNDNDDMMKKERLRLLMFEKIDNYLNNHELKIKLPKELVTGEIFPFVPKYFFDNNVPKEIIVPLSSETKKTLEEKEEGRGLMKKVIIPFLLGLKVKASVFVPLAIALIAMKTWKALTLGLLSAVLSAAMVIFKFAKPKVVNYEVYHYPTHHSPPQVVEHHPPPHHPYVEHHGYGRSSSSSSLSSSYGQDLAYNAYKN
ncbi:conserved hypothetical protein [Pediculus humanus corporis]|uniref:Uncharacterized protein n=1 Tax=Pediculus humanus subsp. corporis TaxID=121224 RepID=E0VX97_PEDHC|nr:uncharacterized protein Phum_PHUM497600 [Pediculus humanus corporis]EEB18003.1 conserved hypothetical protein [Pediculus humanus corporis]